ncbi:MAG: protease modulator HflK, partial [Planctomycetota bacterium]
IEARGEQARDPGVRRQARAGVLHAVASLLALELTLRMLTATWLAFYDRVPHPGSRLATDAWIPRLFASRLNPLTSLFTTLADAFGVDLRGTYALVVARRALGPIVLALAFVGWLATGAVSVPLGHVAVAERFGARLAEPLGPGLHLRLPWPLARAELVATDRVRDLALGYRGGKQDADRLWTVAHADEEYTLLLGDGTELVSLNARLEYRVTDPVAFVYSSRAPEAVLGALAERSLTRATIDRRLEDVLSENVTSFGAEVATRVQQAADSRGLGVEVLGLVVRGLHPPLAVAEDYQRVVAAQVERDRMRADAEAYADRERIAAQGVATTRVRRAQADAATRLARARGEAAAFTGLVAASRSAPALFRRTAYLRALREALEGRPFHVIDRRIEDDGGDIWLLE